MHAELHLNAVTTELLRRPILIMMITARKKPHAPDFYYFHCQRPAPLLAAPAASGRALASQRLSVCLAGK